MGRRALEGRAVDDTMTHHTDTEADAISTVYVLGSGTSMLDLTDEEKNHIALHPCVGMNKYVLFWDLAGIFPTHFFLADIHYPAMRVYEESVAIIEASGKPVHYLLAEFFRQRYGTGLRKRLWNAPFRLKQHVQHGFLYAPDLTVSDVTYFKRCQTWYAPQVWGTSLDDLMYFYRGSLSVLLNLLCVLNLGKRIKLLGVDLSTSSSFYDEAIKDRPYLVDQWMRLQQQGVAKRHVTAEPIQGMPGIQEKWPFIQSNVERMGFALYCCNPKSLLVEEGLCPYAPVLD